MEETSKQPAAPQQPDTVDSYGAIVLARTDAGSTLVLLIKNRHGWSFPKGHVEAGETPTATAVRETKEETGIDIAVDPGFCVRVDSARVHDRRNVFFFLGRSLSDISEPDPQAEIKEAKWIGCDDALGLVGYPPDRDALRAALAYKENAEQEQERPYTSP